MSIVLILAMLLACQCAPQQNRASPTAAQSAQPILTINGLSSTQSLTLAQLKALPVTEGYAGLKSSVGTITPPALYKGVSLIDLSNLVGGLVSDAAVEIAAEDGYAMTMSFNEAANGKFVTYDPSGKEISYGDALQAMIAYERDGQPLPLDTDGTLRLVIVSARNDQLTDGHWSIKWVERITIKRMREWTLRLEGYLTEDMDRRTFEEGAAACCHRRPWTDPDGNTWAGVALWRLVGLVDDPLRHQVLSFDSTLAGQGYEIQLVGADGRTVSLDSQRVMYNMDMLVVHQLNDQELGDEYFPLRLVGAGLEEDEMIGQISRIVVGVSRPSGPVEPLPTPTVAPSRPLATPTGGGLFAITGKVQQEVVVSAQDIQQREVTVQGHHFSGELGTYTGARLNELMQRAGPTADAQFIVLTSMDGGEARMPLALLAACPDCMVGIDDNGQATAYMPEQDCYFWMRQLVEIDVR